MNIEIPTGFRDRALKVVDARTRSPLHPLTEQEVDDIAVDLVTTDCPQAAADVVELIALCIRAVIEEKTDGLLGGRLYLVDDDTNEAE